VNLEASESHGFILRSSRWRLVTSALLALLLVGIFLSLNIGFSKLSAVSVLKALLKPMPFLGKALGLTGSDDKEMMIITEIRLPRILVGALAGSGLSLAGVIFQGIFRNPMADPYVIGVSSGAALGAALAIVMGIGYSVFGINTVSALSFLAATLTVLAVYNLARVGPRAPVVTLLLSGVAISIFLSSLVSLMQVFSGWELHRLVYWMMGGFTYIEWKDVFSIFPLVSVGAVLTYFFARDLNVMTLGDEEAQHLGVNVDSSRKILIAVGSLMTAAAVSVGGLIAFVGLLIPRFLNLCDAIARGISSSAELPVGIVTALSGGPFFIYLLRKNRGRYAM
jgi:iron complex transport system permease protein